MSRPLHYILAPLFYFAVAWVGGFFTSQGVKSWYPTIAKPSYTPSGSFIGIVWTIIYILSTISLILFVNRARGRAFFWPIIGLYVLNGIFNTFWSYLFFVRHALGFAVLDAFLIWVTVEMLITFIWFYSRMASLLLLPYFGWLTFAGYLTYVIYKTNSFSP